MFRLLIRRNRHYELIKYRLALTLSLSMIDKNVPEINGYDGMTSFSLSQSLAHCGLPEAVHMVSLRIRPKGF